MTGLLPCNRVINDRINENLAGKSWPVNMRHEVHGKDSGQGLQTSIGGS